MEAKKILDDFRLSVIGGEAYVQQKAEHNAGCTSFFIQKFVPHKEPDAERDPNPLYLVGFAGVCEALLKKEELIKLSGKLADLIKEE